MNKRVFYKNSAVLHTIIYSFDDKIAANSDARTRWAYLIVNKKESNIHLNKNEKDSNKKLKTIKEIYTPYLIKAIKEEEKTVKNVYSLKTNNKEIQKKLVNCSSAINSYSKLGTYSILKKYSFIEEAQKLGKSKTTNLKNVSALYFNKNKMKNHLYKEYNKFLVKETKEIYLDGYIIVAIPYVYNYEDNKDTNSKLIATVKEDEVTSSFLSKYSISGYWSDENKNILKEQDISQKDKETYFYIQTENIKDGTTGELTIIDKDVCLHDEISSLNFTINDNEAFILIEFDKIKFNIIDLIKDERDKKIELFTNVKIKELKIEEELAKDKEDNLITKCGYYKIGTRTLRNSHLYPDTWNALDPFTQAIEGVLDYTNKELIHEHIAFKDDENLGFTTAYEQNNEDLKGKDYGMLKTDPQMSGIANTKIALNEYNWNKIYVDEDTVKEAIYQVINENKYAVSDSIAMMNADDIDRQEKGEKGEKGEEIDFIFTKIIRYTPEEGKRYELLSANCQDFVQKVRNKYKDLKKEAKKKESLS